MIRDKILGAKPSVCPIDCPEWDTTVYVRHWTVGERSRYMAIHEAATAEGRAADTVSDLVCMSLCDDSGTRVFQDSEAHLLADQSGVVLDRIAMAALKHNGISTDAVDNAKKA